MGMFDMVNFDMKCPECGELLNDFQTKDLNRCLQIVEIDDIYNFYTFCKNCKLWIEFNREKPKRKRKKRASIDDAKKLKFNMIVDKHMIK